MQLKSKGTHAILRNSPILFYSEDDFSQVFKYFVSSFIDNNLASNSTDTSHIYDYYNSFIKNTPYELIDFETLVKKTEGYMFFHLVKYNNTKKKLDTFKIKDDIYYILGGTYISPFACSLVENKLVNGMMLDTTFSIIQNYYTSIPTLVIQNAGIPIGFTFGLTENEKIYSEFFKRFENIFGFKIPCYIHVIESDQGTALCTFIEKQGVKHLSCLRHLIVSLKTTRFSEQISNLVQASCQKDFDELVDLYSSSWKSITKEEEITELKSILKKVGLGFVDQKIQITAPERWEEVSMLQRGRFKMPSCTNQIESMHGHLNGRTPRRNEFYRSLKRIIDSILKKNHTFKDRFHKNYSRHKRKILNIVKHTPKEVMESQISYYDTNIEDKTCTCGESALISEMLQTKIPCSHLSFLKMGFPEVQPPKIIFENKFEGELFYEYKIHESKKKEIDSSYYTKIRKSVVNSIKRFSHCNEKTEIVTYVNNKLPFIKPPESFIMGYPLEAMSVIDEGILIFSKDIKKEEIEYGIKIKQTNKQKKNKIKI